MSSVILKNVVNSKISQGQILLMELTRLYYTPESIIVCQQLFDLVKNQ